MPAVQAVRVDCRADVYFRLDGWTSENFQDADGQCLLIHIGHLGMHALRMWITQRDRLYTVLRFQSLPQKDVDGTEVRCDLSLLFLRERLRRFAVV